MSNGPNIDLIKRKLLFTPCDTKDALHDWIQLFLGIDMPDCTIDPGSNSNPMESIWEIYDACLKNNRSDLSRILSFAARDAFKTLSASILEVLSILHLQRSVAHMAAIEQQARKAQSYVKSFFNKPFLRDYIVGDNAREIFIMRYYDEKTDENLNQKQFDALSDSEKNKYKEIQNYIKIILCTLQSANSEHTSLVVIDELDVISNPIAYEEAKMIPTPVNGKLPITLLTSSRKFSFGLVQKEIDEAARTELKIKHWNILDVTERCPDDRHRPDLPRLPIYRSDDTLKSFNEKDFQNLPDDQKDKYILDEGYDGCLNNCKMFAYCKGRLATEQKSTSPLLKPIEHVQSLFKHVSLDVAKAQLLCFGPGTQILMGDGTLKDIEKIKIGDSVVTHLGNVKSITKVFKRFHTGKVYSFQSSLFRGFSPTIVTDEHPYFINGTEFKSIKNIEPSVSKNKQKRIVGDYLSLPINYESKVDEICYTDFVDEPVLEDGNGWIKLHTKSSQSRPIPSKFKLDRDFGWIIGYFLAEGHFSKRKYSDNGREYITAITFSSHAEEAGFHNKVRAFASSMGLTTSEFRSKQSEFGFTQDIYNPTLALLFLKLCGELCDRKSLHKILMNSNIEFLSGVLDGFWSGDGTKRENNYKELTTTSYSLAGQLFLIASRLGLCPRIKRKPISNGKRAYLVEYQNKNYKYKFNRTKYKTSNNYNLYRFDGAEVVDFNGNVYNIEVEDDHSYIANGLSVHNCWKPSSSGLVYPNFDRQVHMISPTEMANKIFGENYFGELTKPDLIKLIKEKGIPFVGGMDFGFSHFFSVVIGAKVGYKFFVLDVLSVSDFELSQKIDLCNKRVKHYGATIYPDIAYPSDIKTFQKNGYKMRNWPKGKGTVIGGIEVVRTLLMPTIGEPRLFILKNDDGCELLAKRFEVYHWKLDAAGKSTDVPDHEGSDELDALRYLCLNAFGPKGQVTVAKDDPVTIPSHEGNMDYRYNQENWATKVIEEITGEESISNEFPEDPVGKKGSLVWSVK